MCRTKRGNNGFQKYFLAFSLFLIVKFPVFSQADGKKGIQEATKLVSGYFDAGTLLLYAIGAIVGIVGAVRVYNKWSSGDPDTSKAAASWFGACIFLVVVATVLKSFYGIK